VALAKAGQGIVILDNLSNSHESVIDRLQKLCGTRPLFIKGDVRDGALLDQIFAQHAISSVIHFAGVKAVGESVEKPLMYYDTNVRGTLDLLAAMARANVRTFVFSSSATVYGDPARVPITEDCPFAPASPYGRSKRMIEDILEDLHRSDATWRIARLRYFNPVGAHESGLIGESPKGIPNNLMPYVTQVAAGTLNKLRVFGGDYPTRDGTGIRDYIHVMDLAEGHVAAWNYLEKKGGLVTVNLGTGRGTSVLELVQAFEKASGRTIAYEIVARRAGDVPQYWADPAKAEALLGWKATRDVLAMCADSWRWGQNNALGV
jgi:UDP-glucose 4-epimerase